MDNTEKIRLMIVDDHKVVRNGLRIFLSLYDEVEIIGEAQNGRQAIELCQTHQPDVVLMDLMMPGIDGPTAIRRIREQNPNIQIVVLTSFEEEALVHQAMSAGAIGYLYKDVDEDELIGAIRAAHAGRSILSTAATQALVRQATTQDESITIEPLTPREAEILALVAKGMTNPQIAKHLVISSSTVNFHIHNIFNKLQARTRTEAATIALQNNMIRL